MPLQLQNILCSCFKSCSERNDRTPRESLKSSSRSGNTNVSKEFEEVTRTASYMDIHNEAQRLLLARTGDGTTSYPSGLNLHLSTNLLEPQQGIIDSMVANRNLHPFLVDFFEATLKACRECEALLQSVRKTRANYLRIHEVIKIAKGMDIGRMTDELSLLLHTELVEFAKLENPLQAFSATQYHDIHDNYRTLLQKMASKLKKVKRRMKFVKLFKKVVKWGLVVSCTVISVALVIGAIHSPAGIVTVPIVVACTLVLLLGGAKNTTRESKRTNPHDRLSGQLDRAAKGIFVLISYYDTIISLLRRLQDKVDSIKATAEICTANMNNELFKVAVKELEVHDSNFMERVQELEDHICLCFLNINRSRRSIVQVTMNM